MKHLTENQLEQIIDKLALKKKQTEENLGFLAPSSSESRESDPLDQGKKEELDTSNNKEQRRLKKFLQKIEETEQRIKNGTYGYSRISGKPIPFSRLLANPIAQELCEEKIN